MVRELIFKIITRDIFVTIATFSLACMTLKSAQTGKLIIEFVFYIYPYNFCTRVSFSLLKIYGLASWCNCYGSSYIYKKAQFWIHYQVSPGLLCSIFYLLYMLWSNAQKFCLYIMLNIMPMTTAIVPQFVYNFILLMIRYA